MDVDYDFLWNRPSYGNVSFGASDANLISWSAQDSPQTDYFITTSDPTSTTKSASQILNRYVDAVGHSPMLPDHAAGYWHSKNRYHNQSEILDAAKGFFDRGIPVDIIVIDYMHWKSMGDWSFDSEFWPDVESMMATLFSYEMKVMVSAWPFSAVNSTSIKAVEDNNLAVMDFNNDPGSPVWWNDNNCAAGERSSL